MTMQGFLPQLYARLWAILVREGYAKGFWMETGELRLRPWRRLSHVTIGVEKRVFRWVWP